MRVCKLLYMPLSLAVIVTLLSFSPSLLSQTNADSSLSFENIKAQAVTIVEQILEIFPTSETETLQRNGKPVRIQVTGINNAMTSMIINDDITKALVGKDAESLVELFMEYYLHIDMDNSSDDVLVLKSMKFNTPEARLYKALYEIRNKDAREIIENESPDLESLTEEGFSAFTPLAVATRNNNLEMVKLLLEHGAEPNNKPKDMLFHPMDLAVVNGHLEMAKVLLAAGVPADLRVGTLDRDPMPIWAVRLDSMELMEALVKKGADPAARGIHGWTALDDALVRGNAVMIDYLVERSNPLSVTQSQRRAAISYNPQLLRTPDYAYFPASNALFLAQTFGNAGIENLEQRLLARAEELNGVEGPAILKLRAAYSASNLAYAEQRPVEAMTELETALTSIEKDSLSVTASSDYVTLLMSMLADLHELRLINGQAFDGTYRNLSEQITAMGGWRGSVHDMLDVLQIAVEEDPTDSLQQWQSVHNLSSLGKWSFRRLNAWLETKFDGAVAERVHKVMDFYELPRFAAK